MGRKFEFSDGLGVQTYLWITEGNIVEVPFDEGHLMERILSPANLNKAYKAVVRNKGCGGVDKMSCEQLLPWLRANKDALTESLMDGTYRPNPVRRVEPLYSALRTIMRRAGNPLKTPSAPHHRRA